MAEDRLAVVVGRGGTAGGAMPDGVGGEERGCRRADMRISRDRVGACVYASSFSFRSRTLPGLTNLLLLLIIATRYGIIGHSNNDNHRGDMRISRGR